ncbi:MAG: hypothetical protein ABIT37_25715 [Luteolibacter sp.]
MNIHSKLQALLLIGGTITTFQSASAAPASEKSPTTSSQNTATSTAEPSQRPASAPAGDAALTPKSLTKGTVLKIKIALTVTTTTFSNGIEDGRETESELNEESLTWKTPTSYGDPDGDEFSCVYKKIDNFTAQIIFDQTKAGGGETLANEHGKGKLILLFTSYDKTSDTYHGTVVTSEGYTGGNGAAFSYKDSGSGSGIFSLKIK